MSSIGHYDSEAVRCEQIGAHTASCIMLGAAIKGFLVLAVSAFPEQAEKGLEKLRANNNGKDLRISNVLRWDFADLLMVAEATGWLPKHVPPSSFGDEPLAVGLVKDLRNLVHPGRLIRTRQGRIISKEELDQLQQTCSAIYLHFARTLLPDLSGIINGSAEPQPDSR